jgi:hypothetical protein
LVLDFEIVDDGILGRVLEWWDEEDGYDVSEIWEGTVICAKVERFDDREMVDGNQHMLRREDACRSYK